MNYGLPTELDVNGERHAIRTDYRAVLDIIAALNDPELTIRDKLEVLLSIFYADDIPTDINEAIKMFFWFTNCGRPDTDIKLPKLMDWEQDFHLIAGAINVATRSEIREAEYMHWWTFIGHYMNIGDSMFSQVVSIRRKLSKGIKLEKYEREFYEHNRDIIDIRVTATPEEEEIMNKWIGGADNG